MFEKLLKHNIWSSSDPQTNLDPKNISVYPFSEYNMEGLKLLLDNCKRMGHENTNVRVATVDPTLWLGGFLDRHWQKISFISTLVSFNIFKLEGNNLVTKAYRASNFEFNSDDELDNFFNEKKFRKLVMFSITKFVDLETMTSKYTVRLADITEKYEERDMKIEEILK
jgi:hypothetical protein